jgi:hypothetical protein
MLRRRREARRGMKGLQLLRKTRLSELLKEQRLKLKDLQRQLLTLINVMSLSLMIIAMLELKTYPLLAQM